MNEELAREIKNARDQFQARSYVVDAQSNFRGAMVFLGRRHVAGEPALVLVDSV